MRKDEILYALRNPSEYVDEDFDIVLDEFDYTDKDVGLKHIIIMLGCDWESNNDADYYIRLEDNEVSEEFHAYGNDLISTYDNALREWNIRKEN